MTPSQPARPEWRRLRALRAGRAGDQLESIAPLPGIHPEVRIAAEDRADRATVVRLEGFDGPLALLLSLIEARQLDVLTVPLGALAGAYLDALAGLEVERLDNVSAFIAVASQLILIKSRALLPRSAPIVPGEPIDDGPDPEAELRARLLLYRAHRDAARRLLDRAADRGMFRREPGIAQAAARSGAAPIPPRPMNVTSLPRALRGLIRLAPTLTPPPEVMPRTVRIGDRANVIRAALRFADSIVLQELLADVTDRVVRAVTFLAMLELVKRREIEVEQDAPWGPIVARRVAGPAALTPSATGVPVAAETGGDGRALTTDGTDDDFEAEWSGGVE